MVKLAPGYARMRCAVVTIQLHKAAAMRGIDILAAAIRFHLLEYATTMRDDLSAFDDVE